MAHTCPICGQQCNCNGDIEDGCYDHEVDVLNCTHCDDYFADVGEDSDNGEE